MPESWQPVIRPTYEVNYKGKQALWKSPRLPFGRCISDAQRWCRQAPLIPLQDWCRAPSSRSPGTGWLLLSALRGCQEKNVWTRIFKFWSKHGQGIRIILKCIVLIFNDHRAVLAKTRARSCWQLDELNLQLHWICFVVGREEAHENWEKEMVEWWCMRNKPCL